MGHWQDRLVFVRDFAFSSKRFHMTTGNIGDAPATTFAELLSGPMINIYVGPEKRHWALHRNLLCHHSDQLAAELLPSNETKKRAPDKLELLDDDPSGFELLVKWLYQGKLDDVSDIADPNRMYEYAVSCHKLYLLCERFDMPQLKNIAMDQYRKGLNEAELVPDGDEINEIYSKSGPGSPFRRLMTKIAARQIMDPGSEKDAESYRSCFSGSPDFAIDLVNAIKAGTGGKLFDDPTEGDECTYHDHDAGPNCHIKGKGRAKQAYKASSHRPRARKPVLPAQTATALPTASASLSPPTATANSTSPRQALPKASPPTSPPPPVPPAPQTVQTPSAPQTPQPRPPRRPGAFPLRRGPSSSTVSTSTEMAVAAPLSSSPQESKEKFRVRTLSASGGKAVGLGEATVEEDQQEGGAEQVPPLPTPPSTAQSGLRLSYEGALRRQASRSSLASKTASPDASKTSKTPDSGKSDKARDRSSVDSPKSGPVSSPPSKTVSATSKSTSRNSDNNHDARIESSPASSREHSPLRRRLWDWARVGVHVPRLGLMSRRSHSDLKAAMEVKNTPASHLNIENTNVSPVAETRDDFSVPSAVSTTGTSRESHLDLTPDIAMTKAETLGQANNTFFHAPLSPLAEFAETKSSSDDIVAESNGHWADSAAVTPLEEPDSFTEAQECYGTGLSSHHGQTEAKIKNDDEHQPSREDDEQRPDSSNFWTEDAKGVAGAIFAKAGGLTTSRWAS